MIDKIVLPPEQQKAFERMLEISILQTLNDEGMLSDAQLNLAISILNSQSTCASNEIAVQ
jgi:hypothetical protein